LSGERALQRRQAKILYCCSLSYFLGFFWLGLTNKNSQPPRQTATRHFQKNC
jgi:hypothetical protein